MKQLNGSVYLKTPTLDELYYSEMLYSCKKTMAFNQKWGGTVPFPKEKWPSFFENYLSGKTKNVYFHVYNLDHVFVGEVSARYNQNEDNFMLNIKIKHEYRGNHHAFDALECFLNYMFDEKDVNEIVDDVASDNIKAIEFLSKFGFEIVNKNEEIVFMRLRKEDF